VQFYTADSLAAKCQVAGFTIQEIKHIGYGVPHWSLDTIIRQSKVVDDVLDVVGRSFWPKLATSLYFSLTK
jgi:hypothetical protein